MRMETGSRSTASATDISNGLPVWQMRAPTRANVIANQTNASASLSGDARDAQIDVRFRVMSQSRAGLLGSRYRKACNFSDLACAQSNRKGGCRLQMDEFGQ
jgi:hypothetical protein